MSKIIKVGMCVSYDWEMLRISIPLIYEDADIICLGLDKDRHAWSCKPFEFDQLAFYKFVQEIDKDGKVIIYEDDFSLENLNTRENCNRHRMLIAEKMGAGGWHIQIDADEYYLDFKGFVKYIKNFNSAPKPTDKPINISCPFVPLIKRVNEGYLYVDFKDKDPEIIPMATNKPDYQRARQNGHFNHIAPYYVIHETWARSETELWYKINNWGHASEELTEKQKRLSYFNLWKSLDGLNFQYIFDFHPAKRVVWPALGFITAKDINELIQTFPKPKMPYNRLQLKLKNSRNYNRLRGIMKFF